MKRAFTIVELLVVVCIIGILSLLALPKYHQATEKAKMSECWSILKQIVVLQHCYYNYNGTLAGTSASIPLSKNHRSSVNWGNVNTKVQHEIGFDTPMGESRFSYSTNPLDKTKLAGAMLAISLYSYKQGDCFYLSDMYVASNSLIGSNTQIADNSGSTTDNSGSTTDNSGSTGSNTSDSPSGSTTGSSDSGSDTEPSEPVLFDDSLPASDIIQSDFYDDIVADVNKPPAKHGIQVVTQNDGSTDVIVAGGEVSSDLLNDDTYIESQDATLGDLYRNQYITPDSDVSEDVNGKQTISASRNSNGDKVSISSKSGSSFTYDDFKSSPEDYEISIDQ